MSLFHPPISNLKSINYHRLGINQIVFILRRRNTVLVTARRNATNTSAMRRRNTALPGSMPVQAQNAAPRRNTVLVGTNPSVHRRHSVSVGTGPSVPMSRQRSTGTSMAYLVRGVLATRTHHGYDQALMDWLPSWEDYSVLAPADIARLFPHRVQH